MSSRVESEAVTVVVRRRVKPGCQAGYEAAMQGFIPFALSAPGNLGMHILRPAPGAHAGASEYLIVNRFADAQARQSFRGTPEYREWMRRLREFSEEDPHFEEHGGLSGWFTLPGALHAKPPTRIKMALVTFVGVYPLTSLLPPVFNRLLPHAHPLLVNVVVTGLIVASLTWLIMPLLTRLLRRWLFPALNVPESGAPR